MRRVVTRLIRDQVQAVSARIREAGEPTKALRLKAEDDPIHEWLLYVLWDPEAEAYRWQAVMMPLLEEALRSGAVQTLATAGVEFNFSIHDPRVREFLADRQQMIKTIVGNREAELRASLATGYEAGETWQEMVERVRGYGADADWKADRIARTEIHTASNVGGLEGIRQAGFPAKEWVATRDLRTRDAHGDPALGGLDGKTIPAEDDFSSTLGGRGPAPGQMGNAADDINCRCAVVAAGEPEL